MTWLALPLFSLAAYFLAGRHIRKQREADAAKYGDIYNPSYWRSDWR